MPPILFAVESAESRSLPLNAQRLVNFFTEKEPQGAKSQTPLFGVPGMSAFANTSTILGALAMLGGLNGGTGYGSNTFQNVPLTGGSGSGAIANISISGGAVTTVTLVQGGTGYQVNDVQSCSNSYLGGTGSGFSVPVSTVQSQGIAGFSSINGGQYTFGSGGSYLVPLTGGSGSGATGVVVISWNGFGDVVSSVTIANPGNGYRVGDVMSANSPPLPSRVGPFSATVSSLVGSAILTLGSVTGGSNYNTGGIGSFTNVPLTGGSGTGALANFTITSGAVSTVALVSPGINYNVGDVLSASNSNLGGSGSGFSITVQSVDVPGTLRGSWTKQDVPYVV